VHQPILIVIDIKMKLSDHHVNPGFTLTSETGQAKSVLKKGFTLIRTPLRENLVSSKSGGFTLIELLTVMAIIGILAALSLFSFQGAREQGRDAKRKTDLETIRSALEIYKADCNTYPNSLPSVGSKLDGSAAPCTVGSGNVYLQKVPGDPTDGSTYTYAKSGNTYKLCATLEDNTTGSCSAGAGNYEVTSP
jgi:general secretion pathway protein G